MRANPEVVGHGLLIDMGIRHCMQSILSGWSNEVAKSKRGTARHQFDNNLPSSWAIIRPARRGIGYGRILNFFRLLQAQAPSAICRLGFVKIMCFCLFCTCLAHRALPVSEFMINK